MDYRDVLEFIVSGASCVGLGTATLIDPDAAETVTRDLTAYMKRKKIPSIKTLRGKAHEK